MKKIYPLLLLGLVILIHSCQKEENIQEDPGYLTIDVGLIISEMRVNNGLKSVSALEDFRVSIKNSDGTEYMTFERLAEIPDSVELEPGYYYVEAHSDNNLPAAFENPYYYGKSTEFIVLSGQSEQISIVCKLANTMVSVSYSESVQNSFTNFQTEVSTSLGYLLFEKDETRPGYFQTSALTIEVELEYLNPDGSLASKSLSGTIPDPEANRHYEILVNTTIDDGSATFLIELDEMTIPVEVIEIGDAGTETQSEAEYGDIIITEIMYNPTSLSDSDGEWFEIYNCSSEEINLYNFSLVRDSSYSHIISEEIILLPGEYYVLARSYTATEALNSYSYGSDLLLPNTGATLAVYKPGSLTEFGDLIFSVNYGLAEFPVVSGASISLDPGSHNAQNATDGSFWCAATSIFSSGDSGTPGINNDICE